jgi:hypothetical protein
MRSRYEIERGDPLGDKDEVIALHRRYLADPELRESRYRRYYEASPFGPPAFWVAREKSSSRIVGTLAVFPTRLVVGGVAVPAGIQGDFVVDADHRGPFGPAVPLVRAVNEALEEMETAVVFGVPNERSAPIVAALSCRAVGRVDVFARVLRTADVLGRSGGAWRIVRPALRLLDPVLRMAFRDDRYRLRRSHRHRVERVDAFDDRFERLWRESAAGTITAERSVAALNWKFGFAEASPDRGFALIAAFGEDGAVAAYAVVVLAGDRLSVLDFVARPDGAAVGRLLGALVADGRAAGAAGIGLRYLGRDGPLTEQLRSFGFVRRRSEATLAVRICGPMPRGVDPFDVDSWYFLLGDTDV